jgi:predicted metal-dependent enzyme (double-stranded beta helix superfamily)
MPHSLDEIIGVVQKAVRLNSQAETALAVKEGLERLISSDGIRLPHECQQGDPTKYARRLLYRDAERGFALIAMTWGPGQGTSLHDHAGIWCVEGVIQGEIVVTQFELREEQGDRCRFAETGRVHAGVGGSGALIPPYEHHIISNALPSTNSITLHIYGDEMKMCNVFVPERDGWYRREQKNLSYN